MPPKQTKRIAVGITAIAASLLAGCHHQSQTAPPVATDAQQQQEQAKENAHMTPDQQAASKTQAAAQAAIKPEGK